MRTLAAIAITLCLGAGAFAQEAAPKPRPCRNIVAACQAAGYARHAKEKNLHRDCMKPILTGGTVEGVSVDANDVQACRARVQEHLNKQ